MGDGRSVLEMFLLSVCVTAAGACSGAGCSGERTLWLERYASDVQGLLAVLTDCRFCIHGE